MSETILSLALQLGYLFTHLTVSNGLDMTLVAVVFFVAFQALHQTRALQILRGVIIAAILGGGLLVVLPLVTLNWLVRFVLLAGAIALPLLFQDELRRILIGLGELGRRRGSISNFERFKQSLISAACQLSARQTGALIVLEGKTLLEDIVETGVRMQAEVISPELLLTIFSPRTPLHDGAVILRGDRLLAAGCILPVETNSLGDSQLGTRHRAALGLSGKVNDSLVIIVSEETGRISVAYAGRLYLDLSADDLEDWLNRFGLQLDETYRVRWGWLRGGGLRSTLVNVFFSITLAVIAWLIVMFQTNPPGQIVLQGVALQVEGLQENLLLMSELPANVNVQVQTTSDRIGELTPASVQAQLNLTSLDAGAHSVPLTIRAADPYIQVLGVKPANLDVVLEPELTETITPTVRILDLLSLPPGYVVADAQVSPQTIQIQGPQSRVDQVAGARVEVSIGNRRADFQETGIPLLFDSNGRRVEGLTVAPEQLMMTIDIERTFFSREVGVQPVVESAGLGVDYEIARVAVEPATVTLTGSEEDLRDVGSYVSTAPISITNQVSGFTVDVPLIVPESITVLNENGAPIRSVRVEVTITPVNGYLVLQRQVQIQDAPPDLSAVVTPAEISVLLIGPKFLLQEIQKNPALVAVYVTLEDTAPGSYLLPIQVEAPAEVQVQLFPRETQVRID